MLRARTKRTTWFAMALSGVLLVGCAIWLPEAKGYDLTGLLAFLGGLLIIFGGLLGAFAHRAATAEARLRAGVDLVARWRVDAADWDRFIAFDVARGPISPNELWLPRATPDGGVEIVIAMSHVLVGDCLLAFEDRLAGIGLLCLVELPSDPPSLEIVSRVGGKGEHAYVIRLPLPAAARAETEQAIAHLRTRAAPGGAEFARQRYGFDLGANVPRGVQQIPARPPVGWAARNRQQLRTWGTMVAVGTPLLGVPIGSGVGDTLGFSAGLWTIGGALALGIATGAATWLMLRSTAPTYGRSRPRDPAGS